MSPNEKIIMEESARLCIRYSSQPDLSSALRAAFIDLTNATDYTSLPFDDAPTKMEAIDFMRLVAMVSPELITLDITKEMRRQFAECNDSSKIGIATIFALASRCETVPFLKKVIAGIADPSDWTRKAAEEAIDILEGHREIGAANMQGRFVCRIIRGIE